MESALTSWQIISSKPHRFSGHSRTNTLQKLLSTCSQNDFQDFFLKIFFFNSFSGAVS
jgi:hypothetical protein